ncbi:hypothetical protein FNH88_19385 [Salmonella enterica subsp. salamae]|nr:hypothetical protein [Salmonella enterica subsp. salamae]
MTKISGVYLNGFGEPVAGVQLVLTARATSASVITTTTAQQITGVDGSYSFDVLAGAYVVAASGSYLGVITVGTDSPDGTLNDYLAGYDPSTLTPEIVQTVEELVKEAQEAASVAQDAAAEASAAAVIALEGGSVPTPGEPGSIILCSMNVSGGSKGGRAYDIGAQKSGSLLRPCGLVPDATGETKFLTMPTQSSTSLAGTWAACSLVLYGTGPSLWVRIDTPDLINSGTNLLKAGAGCRIRNCRYANETGTVIDCEVNTTRGWLPFTATPDDSTEWGPKIYAAAVAGEYGEVLACGD